MSTPAQHPIQPMDDTTASPALPSPSSSTSQDPVHSPFSFNTNTLPHSFLSGRTGRSGKPPSHRLSILGKIPKDLSSFLRTGSLSRQNGILFQETSAKLGHSGYADLPEPASKPERAHLRNMFPTPTSAADERPARKLKKENKFYSFLTRSRSRSKTDHSPPRSHDPIPDRPRNSHTKETSGTKPPSRIPSRPISSTTTATNSTVTPGTPKAKKQLQSAIPVPLVVRPVVRPEDTAIKPNQLQPNATSQSTSNRRKLNIFGISISGQRRPSISSSKSKSLPDTPRASLDIPPLPTFGFEEDSRNPQPASRPSSPALPSIPQETAPPLSINSVAGHDPPAQATETRADSRTGSPKPRGFFSGRDSSRSRDSNPAGVPANLVSAPIKRVSSNQRHSIKSTTTDRPTSSTDLRASSPISNIPRIIHTPATPVRAATVSGGTAKTAVASTSRSGHLLKNRSLDNGYRYRGTMDVVDEEGRLSKEIATAQPGSKGKRKEGEGPQSRINLSRMSTSVRNTKHGSFDFERPGLGVISIQRSSSNGTASTGWSRSEDDETVRESALGPGLAGVGTVLQREVSMKRGKEREEKVKEIEKQVKEAVEKVVDQPEPSLKPSQSPGHSSHGHQTPPSGTTSGKSSSLSKASGKRLFGKGSSVSRGNAQHGTFSFEPPVPSPTWSIPNPGTSKEASTSWAGRGEKQKAQPPKQKEPLVEKKSIPRQDRPRHAIHVPLSNATRRPGGKGRSLDLNLGLSWAPSKVREDVLLSSSALLNRSISTSSSARSTSISRSANSHAQTHGRVPSQGGDASQEESKIARETAEMFRKALGEARYMRFKTYIYQFDGQEIPFDGPTGIISKVDGLLATVPTLGFEEKRQLMDKLVRIILQNA